MLRLLRQHGALAAICALGLALLLPGIDWGLPSPVSWSLDDISPWRPLALPWHWARSYHKYPYLHMLVDLVFYSPYLAWLAATGGLDLGCLPAIFLRDDCFADRVGAPTVLMLVSRGVTAGMGVGTLLLTHRLALELHRDRSASLLAALITAVSPAFVLYGHLGNVDVPVTFWLVLTLVFFARGLRSGARRDYVGFALATACALTTKESIYGAHVGAAIALAVAHLRARRPWRDLLLVPAIVAVWYVLVQNLLFNWQGFLDHVRYWLPQGETMMAENWGEFGGYTAFARRFLAAMARDMGLPLALLCAAGIPWAARRRPAALVLLLPAAAYAVLSLALAGYVQVRFLVPLIPLLAVFGGLVAADLLRARPPLRALGVSAVALALAYGLLASIHVDLLLVRDPRYAAEAWFAAHVPRGARVTAWNDPIDVPRLGQLGYALEFLPPEEGVLERLAASRPDYLVVSSTPAGPGAPRLAGRPADGLVPGWRLAREFRVETPLDRWFDPPVSWLGPRIAVLEPES